MMSKGVRDHAGIGDGGLTVVRIGGTPYAPDWVLADEEKAIASGGGTLVAVPVGAELTAVLPKADVLVRGGATVGITRRTIEAMPKCRGIVTVAVGYDNVDVGAATEHGIAVANVRDFCTEEVALHAIMLILACARKLVLLNGYVKAGKWDAAVLVGIPRICDTTLGLIAYGKIARKVAAFGLGVGMRVVAYDPYVSDDTLQSDRVRPAGLEELLRTADFVSIHSPLTAETEKLLGDRELGLMKRTAFLINTARGRVVDERALVECLRRRGIAGAGLDVFAQEPIPAGSPLLDMESVILTPHSAGFSEGAVRDSCIQGAQQAAQLLRGYWPTNLVNPEVKARSRYPLKDYGS